MNDIERFRNCRRLVAEASRKLSAVADGEDRSMSVIHDSLATFSLHLCLERL